MKGEGRKHTTASPCAACKLLRRRCTQGCVFAPHFPSDEPQKFASVHKVFGASNVSKLLRVSLSLSLCLQYGTLDEMHGSIRTHLVNYLREHRR